MGMIMTGNTYLYSKSCELRTSEPFQEISKSRFLQRVLHLCSELRDPAPA